MGVQHEFGRDDLFQPEFDLATGERVDPEEAVRETLKRYPNVMEHLAEAERREETPSKLIH